MMNIADNPHLHKTDVSCCFFSLIISTLENNLKISLKKFANSKKVLYICIVKQLKQKKNDNSRNKNFRSINTRNNS